ncbi:MAG TPA: hypothetical protein VGA20_06195 [Gemmatimonadales bacterium]
MSMRQWLVLSVTLALMGGIGEAQQQALARYPSADALAGARVTFAPVFAAHEQIATRFRSLWGDAVVPRATVTDRVSFLGFLRFELIAQLDREGRVLYPVFDSLTDGTYATTAALLDRQAIGRLIEELGGREAYRDLGGFKAKSHAVAVALETYFTKTEFLVLPVVRENLSESGIRALLARL